MRSVAGWFILGFVTLLLTSVTAVVTVVYDYRMARANELAAIDALLLTRANGVANAVPSEWQDRIELQQPYDSAEYEAICDRLALMISGFKGVGVGTAVERDGEQWISAAVMIPDHSDVIQAIPARSPILEPDPGWTTAIKQRETLYIPQLNLLGIPVRVVAISLLSPTSDEYAAAAFMTHFSVEQRLDDLLAQSISRSLVYALMTIPFWLVINILEN